MGNKFCLFLFCSLLPAGSCFSQWTRTPFEQKVFVENRRQYVGNTGISEEILFWARSGGINLYFTKSGLKYRYNEEIPETPAERAERKKQKKYRVAKAKQHALDVKWLGGNTSVSVVAEEKAAFYYSYSYDPATADRGVRAHAYKKITYKNMYPGIDVEYVLPDKGGVKYDLVLHPGADLSLVKMMWSGESLHLDKDGNLIIKTSMGDFVDHAPQTFYAADKRSIPSAFSVKENIVSFVVSPSSLPTGKAGMSHVPSSIIIDPWTTNPNFTFTNAAYDVDYDFARNVYAYGGNGMNAPFELMKLDPAGAIQWVFVTNVFSSSNFYDRYGDFAVDGASQRCYIVEGMKSNGGTGARVLKIDPAGNQIGLNPGSPNLKELWRIAYNSCTKQGVIGGSGLDQPVTSAPWNAAVLDTTMATMNPVAMLPFREDVDLLAIDNSGSCFMGFSTDGSPNNNQLLKAPVPALLPTNYVVVNDLKIAEVQSVSYVGSSSPNGTNGIAVNGTDLYTYNGSKVVKHNKNTGAVVNTRVLTPPQYNVWSLNQITVLWSGIAVDACNNIFVGSHDTIYQLDASLNKVGFILASNMVYDLKLSPQSDTIYVAGENFISCLQTNIICNGMNISTAVSGSCASSSATVTATGGAAPYTYLWSPSGQTGQVASGLATGTHTVTVWDNSCPPIIQTTTVNITSGALTASVSSTPAACLAANGSATVTPTGGSAPFTYSWSPTGGANPTASGLSAGTYSVTVTDGIGCSGISTVVISAAGGPTVSVTGLADVLCFGGSDGSASINASGGATPYTYLWNNGLTTSSSTNLSAGNYSVTVTDSAGCSQVQTLVINTPAPLTATASATMANCLSNDGSVSVTASGGTSPYSYLWSSGQTDASVSNLASGSYSVLITDANGCIQSATAIVTSAGGPLAGISADVTITAGSSATLSASGGGSYAWSSGDIGSPIVVAPSVTTVYCVTVTDANNCIDTACVTVYIITEPVTSSSCATLATEDSFVLPSAFSPNGDGQNDKWRMLFVPELIDCVLEFNVIIYNRWGELVFESIGLAFAWDGTHREMTEGTAVFAYYLSATMKDGTIIKKKGNVSLLR